MERLTKLKGNYVCWNGNQDYSTRDRYAKVLDHLAAYEDTGLTPEQIKAQQQEIDRLTYENRQLKAAMSEIFNSDPVDYHNPADTQEIWQARQDRDSQQRIAIREMEKVDKLTKDKDEQAGTIMRYDTALKQARHALSCAKGFTSPYGERAVQDAIKAIDALLGGAEDVGDNRN